MRLKKINDALIILKGDSNYYINNPKDYKGCWNKVFNNNNPINIEIGCGKGGFIINMARFYPSINFIAIEKFDSVLLRTLQNIKNYNLSNLKLILYDAICLNDVFEKGEVNNIYLNFSDPWPKTKHRKRRLTSDDFLNVYQSIMKNDSIIIQKTDNIHFFEYSIEQFNNNHFLLNNISLNLHDLKTFNIKTEYEQKYSSKGPIYKLEASLFKKDRFSTLDYKIIYFDKLFVYKDSIIKLENDILVYSFNQDTLNNKLEEIDKESTYVVFKSSVFNILETIKSINEIFFKKSKFIKYNEDFIIFLYEDLAYSVCEIYVKIKT